ncbi:hypothetical protein LH29_16585 [Draconibacterium sediminis]|uniref:Uncharacterized protein n=1 Tax=Draconibacterium sediminis TaxID=1544798 RepID=A0A0D8J7P9_9BACT|nr:hypothetical protein LH29_16585 [Draconibacterium sediminis]
MSSFKEHVLSAKEPLSSVKEHMVNAKERMGNGKKYITHLMNGISDVLIIFITCVIPKNS